MRIGSGCSPNPSGAAAKPLSARNGTVDQEAGEGGGEFHSLPQQPNSLQLPPKQLKWLLSIRASVQSDKTGAGAFSGSFAGLLCHAESTRLCAGVMTELSGIDL